MYRQEAPRSLIFVKPPEQDVGLASAPEKGAPAGVEKPAPPQAVVRAAVVYLSESPVGQVVVVVLDVDVVVDVDELVLDEDEVELDVDVLVLDVDELVLDEDEVELDVDELVLDEDEVELDVDVLVVDDVLVVVTGADVLVVDDVLVVVTGADVLVVDDVLVVVAPPQSWKQHEHEEETVPPIAAQAAALLALVQLGGPGSMQVTPLLPHAVPWASQLCSSVWHVFERLEELLLTHRWKAPLGLSIHCPEAQQFDCTAPCTEQR